MELSLWEIIIAAFTGFSSGMFGIGGSVIATPLLLLAGITPLFALTTPVAVAFFSSLSGSSFYVKKKMVYFKLAIYTLLTAVPFSLLGKYLIGESDIKVLIVIKALFLLLLGFKYFIKDKERTERLSVHRNSKTFKILVTGTAGGFLSGILAIGGGIVFVTAFAKVLQYDLKDAIATSLFCVGVISLINTLNHIITSTLDLRLASVLVIFAIPFSYLGAKTAVKLKNRTLELIFGSVLILFSLYFIVYFLVSY